MWRRNFALVGVFLLNRLNIHLIYRPGLTLSGSLSVRKPY
jgi:hypothetical protein